MITIKTPQEIEKLKIGGHILANILRELEIFTQENYQGAGFVTLSIEKKCEELLSQNGVIGAFKDYSYHGSDPYPANLCVSVNDEVVHGIPGNRSMKEGDLVSLDLGVDKESLFTDAAISFILGKAKDHNDELLNKVTRESLYKGIEQAVIGNRMGDIGFAIENHVREAGFKVIRDYCGHGVGFCIHEDPQIPNYGNKGMGIELKEGMVLAIEPMVVYGDVATFVDKNNWTVKTRDGKRASHAEHTIAITVEGPMILTE